MYTGGSVIAFIRLIHKAILIYVLLCASCMGVIIVTAQTDDASRLLFIREHDGYLQVLVFDTSLHIAHRLTHASLDHYTARWSPDGSRIAYFAGTQVMLMTPQGGETSLLVEQAHNCPDSACWSPDGTQLMLITRGSDSESQVVVVDVMTGTIHQMPTAPSYDGLMWWSPDANHFMVRAFWNGYRSLQIVDAAHGETDMITRNPVLQNSERWSPDGQRFAYVQAGDIEQRDIYVGDIATGRISNISQSPGRADIMPVWSPDGQSIAHASGNADRAGLFVVNSDGTGERSLLEVPTGWIFPLAWIDSRILALWVTNTSRELMWVDSVSREIQLIANHVLLDPAPAISPDGAYVIYALTDATVGIVTANGEQRMRFTAHRENIPIGWQWAPNSHQVFYTVADEGRFELVYIVDVDSSEIYSIEYVIANTLQWQP